MAYFAYQFNKYQWWATVIVYSLLAGIWLTIHINYKDFHNKKPVDV